MYSTLLRLRMHVLGGDGRGTWQYGVDGATTGLYLGVGLTAGLGIPGPARESPVLRPSNLTAVTARVDASCGVQVHTKLHHSAPYLYEGEWPPLIT